MFTIKVTNTVTILKANYLVTLQLVWLFTKEDYN